MIGKMKVLGLALVAVLAMSGIAAQAASAIEHKFHSEVDHTILDVTAENHQSLSVPGVGAFTCKKLTGTGTIQGKTVSEVTVTPHYDECTAVIGGSEVPLTITTTSCDYLFTGATTPDGKHSIVHLKCSTPGDHIHLKVFVAGAWRQCLTLPEQTPTVGGFVYKNINGKTEITVETTVEGITVTRIGVCIGSEINTATYFGNFIVTGTDTDGNHKAVWFE